MDDRLLIIGSSYVGRLKKNYLPQLESLGTIEFLQGAGWSLTDSLKDLPPINSGINYSIIFLQLGGNDLKPIANDSVRVAGLMLTVIDTIRQTLNPPHLIVGSLFFRSVNKYLPTPELVAIYNKEIMKLNQLLLDLIPDNHPHNTFWLHPRLKERTDILCDGVHFNEHGLHLFYRSVRGALIFAINKSCGPKQ